MAKSEKIGELAKALSLAQSEMQGAVKDSANPFFKSKFASLESVWDAVRGPMTKNGLAVTQTMGFAPELGPTLITTLMHASGEWISGESPISAKSLTPQEMGSAQSYAKRYALAAMFCVPTVDDDAEAATQRPAAERHDNVRNFGPPPQESGDPGPAPSAPRPASAQLRQGEQIPACPECGKRMMISKYEDAQLKCFPFVCLNSVHKPPLKIAR